MPNDSRTSRDTETMKICNEKSSFTAFTQNLKTNFVVTSLVSLLMLCVSGTSAAAALFSDGFETGNLSNTQNGVKWDSSTSTKVDSTILKNGKYSLKFNYAAAAADGDSFSEQRFDLGALYKELWFDFDLYVPSNFTHRDSPGTDNNKFFRLWGVTYDEAEKVGASFWPQGDGYSLVQADWDLGGGPGPNGAIARNFISSSDRGNWMNVKIHIIAATSAAPGTLQIWKNGTLVIDNSGIVKNYSGSKPNAYRYGYFLGWSNSGFNTETNFFIDNLVISTESIATNPTNPTNPAPTPVTPLVAPTELRVK
jgi:hypothetical protein